MNSVLSTDRPISSGGFGNWFKVNVAGHLLTMIVGGALGFIGSWFTLKDKVEESGTRITQLESSSARKEEMTAVLNAILKQNDSIDKRLGNIEATLMREK